MELDNINGLLEKYFEATATAAEETKLRDYFSGEKVAPHLEAYRPMFNYFAEAKDERSTRTLLLKKRPVYVGWLSVAAAAVVVVMIYFGNSYLENRELEQQKAEYAYQETRRALRLLAQNLERGADKMAYLNEFETTKEKIYKSN
jgi:hypothetical protein